jgi:glycosyltransferase involved in cell wall biosynthesis
MKKNRYSSVIYYVPVDSKYFDRWEYYNVDLKMLNDAHDNVYVAHGLTDFIKLVLFKKINLIYFWWWHSSILVVFLCKIINIETIGTGAVHMFDESGAPDFQKRGYIYRFLNRLAWRFASKILFISQSQYRQITSHEYVSNALVLKSSSIHKESELLLLSKNKKVNPSIQLMTVSWLTKDQLIRKSIDKILMALKLLPTEVLENISLYIVGGEGDGVEFLLKLIADLDLSKNVFIEIDISNERKIQLYRTSDLYIQPSYYEGFGNSVLEAMSYGTPCIVSANTAQPEVVMNTGYIINQISSDEIYKAILDYTNKSISNRENMIENVRFTTSEFHSYESRLKAYLKLFD